MQENEKINEIVNFLADNYDLGSFAVRVFPVCSYSIPVYEK